MSLFHWIGSGMRRKMPVTFENLRTETHLHEHNSCSHNIVPKFMMHTVGNKACRYLFTMLVASVGWLSARLNRSNAEKKSSHLNIHTASFNLLFTLLVIEYLLFWLPICALLLRHIHTEPFIHLSLRITASQNAVSLSLRILIKSRNFSHRT